MQNDIVPPPSDVKQPPQADKPAVPTAATTPAQPAANAKQEAVKPQPDADQAGQPEVKSSKKKSDKPVGVIITAVALFLVLAGFAVYAGLSSDNLDSVYKAASDISNPVVEKGQETPVADVDSVISETEGLQGDVQDLDSEVTDQALGL